MFQTLGHLGRFTIYTYTAFLDLGILAALVWLWTRARSNDADPRQWMDAGLWALVLGVVGARAGYVFANWSFYGAHLGEALAIWTGGLAGPGAIVGALLGLALYCPRRRLPFSLLFDELALPALLVAALSWAGCAAAGCAAGLEVAPGQVPFAVYWPDMYGIYALRWPVQALGLVLSLIALFVLAALPRRSWARGQAGLVSLALIGLVAFLVSWVRGDEMPAVGGWRLDVVVYGAVFLLTLVGGFVLWALQPTDKTGAETANNDGA